MKKIWNNIIVLALLFILGCQTQSDEIRRETVFEYHMLAVGSGLSSIITNSKYKERAIMFDTGIGGPPINWYRPKYSKNLFVVNYLKKIGIKTLDAVFISHNHTDHTSNLEAISTNFPIKNLYGNSSFYQRYLGKLKSKWPKIWSHLKVQDVQPKYHALGLEFNNLTYHLDKRSSRINENDKSLVLSVQFDNQKLLLTGDSEERTEKELINKKLLTPVNFLQVGHHGSRTSTSMDFLNVIKPKTAFASGVNPATYGTDWSGNAKHIYPHPDVVKNLLNIGSDFYWTERDGTLIYKVKNNTATITKFDYQIKNFSGY